MAGMTAMITVATAAMATMAAMTAMAFVAAMTAVTSVRSKSILQRQHHREHDHHRTHHQQTASRNARFFLIKKITNGALKSLPHGRLFQFLFHFSQTPRYSFSKVNIIQP
jgi:hypothetical protein